MTEIAEDRLVEIAERLLRQTSDGRTRWSTTDDENMFYFSGSASSILVSGASDSAGDWNIRMRILNGNGTEVAVLRSSWVETEPDDPWAVPNRPYRPGPHNELLERLYEAVRRSALRIDEVLDSLFRDLDGSS